jgi:hypothetical protein
MRSTLPRLVVAAAMDMPLREIEEPAIPLDLTAFVDKHSGLDQREFFDANVPQLLNDVSLPAISGGDLGHRYASAAADFDIDVLNQEVT